MKDVNCVLGTFIREIPYKMNTKTTRRRIWFNPIILSAIGLGVLLVFLTGFTKGDNNHNNPDNSHVTDSTVTDIDGNLYSTVTIGTQVWLIENLKVTHYRDGSAIPYVSDDTVWSTLISGAYCWCNDDSAAYKDA